MSDVFFPFLPGFKIELGKRPSYSTAIQRAVSGRESRASLAASPVSTLSLSVEVLRSHPDFDETAQLEGFFEYCHGAFRSFLVVVPEDCQVTNQLLGVGDGVTHQFQAIRSRGIGSQPVAHLSEVNIGPRMWHHDARRRMWPRIATPDMWSAGGDLGNFSVSDSGAVLFSVPPPAGVPVLFSARYYYRARFVDDSLSLERFLDEMWAAKSVDLLGSLGKKI